MCFRSIRRQRNNQTYRLFVDRRLPNDQAIAFLNHSN
jgi:hypothetical protein